MRLRSKLLLTALVALVAASFAPGAFAAVKLRALHAIPDVGPVTVYVNGQPAVPSLGLTSLRTGRLAPVGNAQASPRWTTLESRHAEPLAWSGGGGNRTRARFRSPSAGTRSSAVWPQRRRSPLMH